MPETQKSRPPLNGQPKVTYSVVIPVCNEESALPALYTRLVAVMETLGEPFELIFVDDGSRDQTFQILNDLVAQDPRVVVIKLSRNFGDQIARTAGLDHARGDAVIMIDGDLQHPPELIPKLVAGWKAGYQVVYGIRDFTVGQGLLHRWTSKAFYKILCRLADSDVLAATSDFRLLDRVVVDALKQARERTRFLRGLVSWVGFSQKAVHFVGAPRVGGQTKYTWRRMIGLALDAIIGFSHLPLRLVTYLGLVSILAGLVYAGYLLWAQMGAHADMPAWGPLMAIMLVLGGAQLLGLGIIGEYIGRIYEEAKQRPLYIIDRILKAHNHSSTQKSFQIADEIK